MARPPAAFTCFDLLMTATGYLTPVGLCETCANVRVVVSGKGSRFYMCRLSAVDPAFPRYPRLPVLRCGGYVPAEPGAITEELDAG